jgi:hypothetical protein
MILSTNEHNLNNLSPNDLRGLAKCMLAFCDNCPMEEIESSGYNPSSGYSYIGLDNGISIGSFAGRDVEFIVYNFETGEETFYKYYKTAERHVGI